MHRYCGRELSDEQITWIQYLIRSRPELNRRALARRVCEQLNWTGPERRLKEMSCRVAMLRMERDGWIQLPPPRKGNGNGRHRPRVTLASDPGLPLDVPAGELGDLVLKPIHDRQDSRLWNELVERYHYLGYKPLPGAQLRYFVRAGSRLLGVLGFGAAAWAVAPRDTFIGWTRQERIRNLPLVANNARFLILPWVRCRNLASMILGHAARQLPTDWQATYGYQPVLLETFVEADRFRGTCYRAANWHHVGQTRGRGKLDRRHSAELPVKDILVYPLSRDFRTQLRNAR